MSAPDGSHSLPLLDAYTAIARRLVDDLGLRLTWTDDLGDTAGRYDGPARTVTVNSARPLRTQVWLCHQVWMHCVFGPDATPAGRSLSHLRLVDPTD